jgi:branched-chain amino acid transport system ATP-binding protein
VTVAAGRIDVAGHEITALRVDERAANGVAFVSGAHPVFPDMTVRENLRVGGYLTHRTERGFATALGHVLSFVPALADRVDTRAGLLSGGEQRQLAVAQMLFRRPALLLADELTLGLDVGAQETVLRLLRSLADDGIGVVVVDHDLHALTRVADRVVVVRHGALESFADPAEFTAARHDLLPARFLAPVAR